MVWTTIFGTARHEHKTYVGKAKPNQPWIFEKHGKLSQDNEKVITIHTLHGESFFGDPIFLGLGVAPHL